MRVLTGGFLSSHYHAANRQAEPQEEAETPANSRLASTGRLILPHCHLKSCTLPAAAQRLEGGDGSVRRLHLGLGASAARSKLSSACSTSIRLTTPFDRRQTRRRVPGPARHAFAQHGRLLLALDQRGKGILHVFGGAQHRQPVGRQRFGLCPAPADLGVDAAEIKQPPAQPSAPAACWRRR
jgi:hypothetical protein